MTLQLYPPLAVRKRKQENKERIRKYDQTHYHQARRQMPQGADAKAIIEVYVERNRLNRYYGAYHIDHIIPLRGPFRCA